MQTKHLVEFSFVSFCFLFFLSFHVLLDFFSRSNIFSMISYLQKPQLVFSVFLPILMKINVCDMVIYGERNANCCCNIERLRHERNTLILVLNFSVIRPFLKIKIE